MNDPIDEVTRAAQFILTQTDAQLRTRVRDPLSRRHTEALLATTQKALERFRPMFEAAERLQRALDATAGERKV